MDPDEKDTEEAETKRCLQPKQHYIFAIRRYLSKTTIFSGIKKTIIYILPCSVGHMHVCNLLIKTKDIIINKHAMLPCLYRRTNAVHSIDCVGNPHLCECFCFS